ncbi:dihydrofolate reductase [Pseudomonas maumuensis]|uniref:Dihydrofolate reductase n=1 Tax=Pseudomonas maumuensis TaxID=2842354 RepID=A0ABX8NK18_9PSED|nr:dihydrofolate reductase [Pseudomonas maumuensis]QXH56360.1 dihydrofolate reductase [Pseudomonas maumuensis]
MNRPLPLCLIAAIGLQRVIGLRNQMPWHLPGDFRFFKSQTMNKPIIMGRKTWDSLGRALPGRLNIVVSRQANLELDGAEVFSSLEEALVRADEWARDKGVDELMLIGGAQLYGEALEKGLVNRMYLTQVDYSGEGDAWFPEFDKGQWNRTKMTPQPAETSGPEYHFEVWDKV